MNQDKLCIASSPCTEDGSYCDEEDVVIMIDGECTSSSTTKKLSLLHTSPSNNIVVSQGDSNESTLLSDESCLPHDVNSLNLLSTTPAAVDSDVNKNLSSTINDKRSESPDVPWCQDSLPVCEVSSSMSLDTPSTSGHCPERLVSRINCVNALEDNIQDLSLSCVNGGILLDISNDTLTNDSEITSKANNSPSHVSPTSSVSNESNNRVCDKYSSIAKKSEIDMNEDSNDSLERLNLTASLNFSKLLIKRKQDDIKISCPKKQCTDKQVRLLEASISCNDTPLSSGSSSAMSVRKRIPSKENPPPKLSSWLNTFQLWSNAERLMALDQLIDLCEPTQVRHMMAVIEPQFQRDFISLLPKELALYVLSFLEPRDLLRAAQTCRYWRILAEDNLLWREKCREAGIDESMEAPGKRRLKSINIPSPWKSAYMRQQNIEMNWRFGDICEPKALKGHDDHVITCLQFSGSKIVSGSDDNTLKVWSATTGKCLRTLTGHTGGVWSSQMSGNMIVSGSTDRTLKVWNSDTGQCIHTLYGHTSTVRCMDLHENKVVSGSRDATLRVWNIDSGECLHVLIGHVAAVRCVQYNGRLVVSGAYDYMVKVWNAENEECLHTLQGHTNRVYSLQFDGIHVVSGSLDTSIRVWDVETGSCKHTLMGHQSLTSGMELKNNILVSGNADSTVKVWDITTGQCLQTLSGSNKHHSAVTCLLFNSTFVITSSDDGTVKLWDLKTGEFIRNLVALDSGGSGGVVWRIRSSQTKLVCAVGSRNGTEETKLLVLDFEAES